MVVIPFKVYVAAVVLGPPNFFLPGKDVECMQPMHDVTILVSLGNKVQGTGLRIDHRSRDDSLLRSTLFQSSFFTVAGTEVAPAGLYFKMLVVHKGVGLPLSASNA